MFRSLHTSAECPLMSHTNVPQSSIITDLHQENTEIYVICIKQNQKSIHTRMTKWSSCQKVPAYNTCKSNISTLVGYFHLLLCAIYRWMAAVCRNGEAGRQCSEGVHLIFSGYKVFARCPRGGVYQAVCSAHP